MMAGEGLQFFCRCTFIDVFLAMHCTDALNRLAIAMLYRECAVYFDFFCNEFHGDFQPIFNLNSFSFLFGPPSAPSQSLQSLLL